MHISYVVVPLILVSFCLSIFIDCGWVLCCSLQVECGDACHNSKVYLHIVRCRAWHGHVQSWSGQFSPSFYLFSSENNLFWHLLCLLEREKKKKQKNFCDSMLLFFTLINDYYFKLNKQQGGGGVITKEKSKESKLCNVMIMSALFLW